MAFDLENFLKSLQEAINYLPVTIKLTVVTFVFSLIIGSVIAIIRNYNIPLLSEFFAFFVTVYNGLPLMVALVIYNLLYMNYYSRIAYFFHISKAISDISPIYVGYFALIMSSSCIYSETIRGALKSIDKLQYEAGYSIGLNKFQTLRRIIIPQLIPVALPGLTNNLVGTIKGSNLVSAIGILDVASKKYSLTSSIIFSSSNPKYLA